MRLAPVVNPIKHFTLVKRQYSGQYDSKMFIRLATGFSHENVSNQVMFLALTLVCVTVIASRCRRRRRRH